MVLKRFEQSFLSELNLKMYYLDLLYYRNVSSKIADKFQVEHQSPQLLLVNNGFTIVNASHYDILDVKTKDY